MTQEFHLSVTSIRNNEYLVRTEQVAPGVPLAEEQVSWPVDDWLAEASTLMEDPLNGWWRSGMAQSLEYQPGSASARSPGQVQPSPSLIEFGQRLHDSLFQGRIRDSWIMAQGIAQHQRARLRFRLGLKGTALHRLPWEVLYAGDRPLASGTDVIFSRFHSSFSILKSQRVFQKKLPTDPNQPLRILMVLAAPSDQEVLALTQEAKHLQQELQKNSHPSNTTHPDIELTILEQPGRAQLTQALEHNHYQVLHYAGHSNLGSSGGSLYLVNRDTGLTEILSGDDLAGLLVNNGIRMAVFNSCLGVYTATSTYGDQEGNLAEALVKRGIPAVLAMAERIPDDVALNLSRLFYRNLKQSYPIDLSLSRTRQGLISSYTSNRLYWALPILYLHPDFDGYLQPPVSTDEVDQGLFLDGFTPDEDGYGTNFQDPLQPPLGSLGEFPDSEVEEFPDFEDLEFEDSELPEEERVAELVNALTQSPTLLEQDEPFLSNYPLSAYPTEDLLELISDPESNSYLHQWNLAHPINPPTPNPSDSSVDAAVNNSVQMYAELKNVLVEMGKLTEDIETSHQVVEANPKSCEAYTDFGWALYQQGFLREAISAYHQAIRLNPTYADAYSRLALALYQQGQIEAGMQVYNLAVKLNPRLIDAPTSLRTLLEKNRSETSLELDLGPSATLQSPSSNGLANSGLTTSGLANSSSNKSSSNSGLATSELATVDPAKDLGSSNLATVSHQTTASNRPINANRPPAHPTKLESHAEKRIQKFNFFRRRSRRTRLWIGLVLAGFSTMLATRIFDNQLMQAKEWLFPSSTTKSLAPSAPAKPEDLAKLNQATLELKTKEYLAQGKIADAQTAIAVLLDQGAFGSAETFLQSLPQQLTNPKPTANPEQPSSEQPSPEQINHETNFLKGRLIWQRWLMEPKKSSVLEARRLWEVTAQNAPSPLHENALGFAYYAEGQWELAEQAWSRSRKLSIKTPLVKTPLNSEGANDTKGQPKPPQNQSAQNQSSQNQTAQSQEVSPVETLEMLQAKAGLALIQFKKADRSAPNEQATLRQKAIDLQKEVLESDPANFQVESLRLRKNWMWSEVAIADWKTLLANQPK